MTVSLEHYAQHCLAGLAVFDAAGRLAYANPAFRALLADGGPDCLGRDPGGLGLPPAFASPLAGALGRIKDGDGGPQSFEVGPENGSRARLCRLIPAGGTGEVIVELREAGGGEHLRQVLQAERAARCRAERQRERSRRLFFEVIEELPIFVYMQRRDYTVAYANRKTRNFYGETNGRRCYEVFSGRDSPCPFCPTFRVFDTGRPESWQFTDGLSRTFHIYDYPFEDENGEPLVMELGIDVTELKRVERELFQAHKMRAIGVLAGGIAHDLNNNLLPIIFNIDYALGKIADDTLAEPLNGALRAAYRAADLVEQVLDYSRQQNVSRAPLRLIPLARENLELFTASLPANVLLEADYCAAEDCILANPAQVQQLLFNLCRNAVQAMPEGGRLSVSVTNALVESLKHAPHQGLALGRYVVLKVVDTGQGIEPGRIERIFEPFYTSKKKSGGTGMGLAVVHAITTSAGGSIQVDSRPGQGTVFTVYLPAVEPIDTRVGDEPGAGYGVEPCPARGQSGRLLLVDDDQGALAAMARVLREAGFEVATAASGEAGLDQYLRAGGRFDLVLADQSMPGLDGLGLAARILGHDAKARIVICTGHAEARLENRAEAAGIAAFVQKPMTPRVLVENVRRHCR